MGLFFFILVLIGIAVLLFYTARYTDNQNRKQARRELEKVDSYLQEIEKNPSLPASYEKLIQYLRTTESTCIADKYPRILKLCSHNIENVNAWILLGFSLGKADSLVGEEAFKTEAYKLVSTTLFKKYNNENLREQMLALLYSHNGFNGLYSDKTYNTALGILEKNSSNALCKRMILDIGRLHYGHMRPNKRPTIYDEQAIQNDINVRVK